MKKYILLGFAETLDNKRKTRLQWNGYGIFPIIATEVEDRMDVYGNPLIKGENQRLPTNKLFFNYTEFKG